MKTKLKATEFTQAKKILNKAYAKILTDEEGKAEIINLLRKHEKGSMDDFDAFIFCQMEKSDWQVALEIAENQ